MDTMGRLLNGLDKHPGLRKKIAKKFKQRELTAFRTNKIVPLDMMLLPMGKVDPLLTHCIDLQRTWKKLHKMVSTILDNKNKSGRVNVKPWKSTFLMERELVENPRTVMDEDNKLDNKRGCQKCGKEPQGKLMQTTLFSNSSPLLF
ncbi:MAG: hypothetical protein SGARI_007590 [Bacillariaceae sp.]